MSEAKLAPMNEKQLTIPCLELQAAVLGYQIRLVIIEETKCEFKAVYLWMDYKIVINYIKNETTNFGVFETNFAHHINEIRDNCTVNEWHYVSTKDNIADDLMRYKGFDSLQKTSRWYNGPDFLYNSLENHEIINVNTISTKDKDKTFRRTSNNGQSTVLPTAELNREIPYQNVFITWSSLTKLVHYLAWLLKLKTNWLKWKRGSSERVNFDFFMPSEIATSKLVLCEIPQKESYPSEYHALSNEKPVQQSSKIISLNPIFKDLIKVGGRISHTDVPENAKHQVILAKDHPLSLLVIQNIHKENFHVGREHTVALLRQHYWIPACRGLIRRILHNCLRCK